MLRAQNPANAGAALVPCPVGVGPENEEMFWNHTSTL